MNNIVSNVIVSIVVPVYNAEKYLSRMVDSILNQTFKDFELLLIDDGSSDGSYYLCQDYALKDSRVRVISKENGGVSSARNTGIENAQGIFIAFWDNDDYVYPNYLEVMLKEIENFDLLITRPIQYNENSSSFIPPAFYRSGKVIAQAYFDNLNKVFPIIDSSEIAWVWAQLFRRDILINHSVRFENITSEDTMFSYQYLRYIKSIKMIDYAGYCYIRRIDSFSYNNHKYVSESGWISKLFCIYKELWEKFQIDINKEYYYKGLVANRLAIRLSAFLLKGYHKDTRVSRRERLKRWENTSKSAVFQFINESKVDFKYKLFLSLVKLKMYVLVDPFIILAIRS